MFNRDYNRHGRSIYEYVHTSGVRTLSSVTRSAACSRVSPEISSTILFNFGSAATLGDGGGGVDSEAAAGAAVARHLDELARELGLLRQLVQTRTRQCCLELTASGSVSERTYAMQQNTDSVDQ